MSFAAYPSAVVYRVPGDRSKRNAVQHLIWGDWIRPLGQQEGDWMKVNAR
jgi:hypothetical protein